MTRSKLTTDAVNALVRAFVYQAQRANRETCRAQDLEHAVVDLRERVAALEQCIQPLTPRECECMEKLAPFFELGEARKKIAHLLQLVDRLRSKPCGCEDCECEGKCCRGVDRP